VRISEEAGRVGFDLLETETSTSVNTICQDTSSEWPSQASDRSTDHVGIIADWKRVWKSDTRGTCRTLNGLMDMSRGFGSRLVVPGHALESDVLLVGSVFDVPRHLDYLYLRSR